jgi:hypothetical protein
VIHVQALPAEWKMAFNLISEKMLAEESEFPEIRRLAAIVEITGQNQIRACPEMMEDSG